MKKIFLMAMIAMMGIAFTSCENDPIDFDKVESQRDRFYPEPFTNWDGTIDNVKAEMSKYQELSSGDMFQMDAEYLDGHTDLRWFLYFHGKNPFEPSDNIVYLYCFGNATSDLQAVQVVLDKHIDMSDINAQLKGYGYTYDNFNSVENYHTFYDNSTSVRVYVPTSTIKNYTLMYQKRGDTNQLKPYELQ